jgi:hypothetical protein
MIRSLLGCSQIVQEGRKKQKKQDRRFSETPSGGEFMQKFCFSIKTRDGLPIARLMISGRDQDEAERKLKQMYRFCEIVSCASDRQVTKGQNAYIKGLASFLAKQESISG